MHYYQAAASSNSSESSESWSWSSWGGGYDKKYVRQQSMTSSTSEALERMIVRLASGSAVVIFSISSCCMCHAVKSLLCGMGVNPTVYELDQLVDPNLVKDIESALIRLVGESQPSTTSVNVVVPVVFIGGKLLGPMDRVMASHINGTLVPLLKQAGALWL